MRLQRKVVTSVKDDGSVVAEVTDVEYEPVIPRSVPGFKGLEAIWLHQDQISGSHFDTYRFPPNIDVPPHATPTIDYGLVLEGVVQLVLPDEVITLRPGDCHVQQEAMHGWRTGDEGATVVGVMIHAGRDQSL